MCKAVFGGVLSMIEPAACVSVGSTESRPTKSKMSVSWAFCLFW
jgi:hypothetical protein